MKNFKLSSITVAIICSLYVMPSGATITTSTTASLSEVLADYKVTDVSAPLIETLVIDNAASCSSFYYLEISFPGTAFDKKYQIELDFQTLTEANMNRIAEAIKKNYAQYGLPECMKGDTFDTTQFVSNELKNILMIHATFKGNHHTCFGMDLPYTNCVNVQNLYPNAAPVNP